MHIKMQLSKQKKQVIILTGSTIIGTLLGILNSVLNTRSLEPELFGDVRFVQNIIAFVSSLLLVGYFVSGSRLLALSKDEQYSRRIRGAMCIILTSTMAVVMLVMASMAIYTRFAKSDMTMLHLYLIAIPFCGTVLMLNYINTTAEGDNHIGRIAIARLIPSLLYFLVAFFIYKKFGATPELMLLLFNGLSSIVLCVIILSTKPSFQDIKYSFSLLNQENRKYGFNVYLGSLSDNSTRYIAGITLGAFGVSNASVGYYTLAQAMATPLAMLPAIIGSAYYKQFASLNRINTKVLKGTIGLTILSCVLFLFLIKYVVMFLYNEEYYCVARYASWLSVASCIHGLGDMFNRFLGAHGLGRQMRNSSFACGGVLLFGSLVLVYFFGIGGAIFTVVASSLVYTYMLSQYYIKFVKNRY